MIDLHLHTQHSDDSNVTMEQYCKKAMEIYTKVICFTDHVDNNPVDPGYGKFNPDSYFREFYKVKEKYKDNIVLLSGVEFSEPHIYQKEFEKIRKYPFDYIIGSIHIFYNNMFISEMVKNNIPIEVVYENYWKAIYEMVEFGGFDSIGHLDFPKRYFGKLLYDEKMLEDILKKAVKKNIILEINTSSLRKGLNQPMPCEDLLKIYYKIGGRYLTIGSDSHNLEDLAKDIDAFIDLYKGIFNFVYFKNRKVIEIF
ncbi:MAG: histidinol-phosphatase HisJ family protein [Exilispira sp.]